MHDPMTVAFDIRAPWFQRVSWGNGRYHPSLITIWHVDPEVGGNDDSCDWFQHRPDAAVRAFVARYWDNPDDNMRRFFASEDGEDPRFHMMRIVSVARREFNPRAWWRHPRWHLHHWRIQVHAAQSLNRWLFSRCATCGKGFSWGYTPVSTAWNGDGPRWFRGERDVHHHECAGSGIGSVK